MIKSFDLLHCRAGVTGDELRTGWCQWAASSLAEVPGDRAPLSVVYCSPLALGEPIGDGVVIVAHHDRAAHDRFVAGWSVRSAGRDAVSELVDDAAGETVLTESRTVFGDRALDEGTVGGDGTVVLLGFLHRRSGISRVEFRDYWWEVHRPLANRLVPVDVQPVAYVHNYALADSAGSWDGIGELFDESVAVAKRRGQWFASDAATELIADEARFLQRDTRVVVVARRHVIHPATSQPGDRASP